MSNFHDLNNEITIAQNELEKAIRECQAAELAETEADIALTRAVSSRKKARLDIKLYESRIKSLFDSTYNLRAESRVR